MKVGDKVAWVSQAQGCWKNKSGTVIADIPAGKSARQHIPASAKKSHSKVDKDKSAIDRVLVAVPAGKDGQIHIIIVLEKALLFLLIRLNNWYNPRPNLL